MPNTEEQKSTQGTILTLIQYFLTGKAGPIALGVVLNFMMFGVVWWFVINPMLQSRERDMQALIDSRRIETAQYAEDKKNSAIVAESLKSIADKMDRMSERHAAAAQAADSATRNALEITRALLEVRRANP